MAHINIEERRLAVSELIKRDYTREDIKAYAKQFNCSITAIRSDIIYFLSKYEYTVYPSKKTKAAVLARDRYICQYCGIGNVSLCVDHIIPPDLGGVGYEYNLTAACDSCNIKKGHNGRIWIPDNIKTIGLLNPEWAKKIFEFVKNNGLEKY